MPALAKLVGLPRVDVQPVSKQLTTGEVLSLLRTQVAAKIENFVC